MRVVPYFVFPFGHSELGDLPTTRIGMDRGRDKKTIIYTDIYIYMHIYSHNTPIQCTCAQSPELFGSLAQVLLFKAVIVGKRVRIVNMAGISIDAELKGMLIKAGVTDDVMDEFVRIKCTTVSHFAN